MSEQNLDQLRDWIGKTESVTDTVTAWPVAALAATLDRREAAPQSGDELPPCGHWLYFLEAKPLSELGPDGHPKRGGFLPPVPLPRRMWAGGRLEFLHPVRIGDEIRRDSTILSVEAKHGRSGNLVFVTVEHAVSCDGRVAIREEHDIVYREAARPGDAPPETKQGAANPAWHRSVSGDPVTLFRYSALTFNGHRIHYDYPYVTKEEGYPDLVVHGPLQATLLLHFAAEIAGAPPKQFSFRGQSPLFANTPFTLHAKRENEALMLWTARDGGPIAMTARATW